MTFTEFTSLFDQEHVDTVLMSTFNFSPVFFERCLLRTSALTRARRIVVLMDAGQYRKLQVEEVFARQLNHRYLVVPVSVSAGVFHPKLHCLVGEFGGKVICGSVNLSQNGCTHNLEMFNAITTPATEDGTVSGDVKMVADTLSFFERALVSAKGPEKELATGWVKDVRIAASWLDVNPKAVTAPQAIELVDTLRVSLWEWITERLKSKPPSRVLIISPYYDADLSLLHRFMAKWPRAAFEIVAQEHTSTLQADRIGKKELSRLKLFALTSQRERLLHAKMVAFEVDGKWLVLTGSANFTEAAYDRQNVEACLAFNAGPSEIKALFDKDLTRSLTAPADFTPGKIPPNDPGPPPSALHLGSAILTADGTLRLEYDAPNGIKDLCVTLRPFGCKEPVSILPIPLQARPYQKRLDDQLRSQLNGSVSCMLRATQNADLMSSAPCWLIQEGELTREFGDGEGGNHAEREIRESGRGLVEQLDRLYEAEGYVAVIQLLNRLNIRYDVSRWGGIGGKGFRLARHDPYRPDDAVTWAPPTGGEKEAVLEAVCDFVDRHRRTRLEKHAERGDINGLGNFLDIFVATNRLVFMFYQRGFVPAPYAIDRILKNLQVFTFERQEEDIYTGYLYALQENYAGQPGFLMEKLAECNTAGHLYAALYAAQWLRASIDNYRDHPLTLLQTVARDIEKARKDIGFKRPSVVEIMHAVEECQMLTEHDVSVWREQLAGPAKSKS